MNLYVGNLSYQMTENDLQSLFAQFGDVSNVNIIKDRETGNSKGFGFVEMASQDSGEKAITDLDGTPVEGRNIKVNAARPKRSYTSA